jgi:thiamine biosynthesis lipoprotein
MTIVVETTDAALLARARALVEQELAAADAAYSPVRQDTELARLHAARGARTAVSPHLLEAVEAALGAARATGGLVDPCAEPKLVAAGGSRVRVARRSAHRRIECDRDTRSVRLPQGVQVDLGATGKALIADRAVARIATHRTGALVSVGGDLATAGPAPRDGWLVRVTDDHRAATGGECIRLTSGALATSGTAARGAHIIDPRDGLPAAGPWRTAAVAAATCVDANAASTAAIVLGEHAPEWLAAAGLPALLVAHDGTTVRVAGWPEASP